MIIKTTTMTATTTTIIIITIIAVVVNQALGEFTSLCKEKDDSTLQAVLPFWPRLFNKLAIVSAASVIASFLWCCVSL